MSEQSSPVTSSPKSNKRVIAWAIKFAITAVLFVFVFRKVSGHAIWNEIKSLQWQTFIPWFIAAVFIKACGVFSSVLRWRLLLIGQGIRVRFWYLVRPFLVGRFFGLFLPGTLGLDSFRLYEVGRITGQWVESASVIAVEKLIGLISLTFLVFLTLPLGLTFLHFNIAKLTIILIFLGIFVAVAMSCLMNPRIIAIMLSILPVGRWPKVQGLASRLAQALTTYSRQRALLLQALFLGFLVHFTTALMYFCTAMAIRTAGIHLSQILFASPIMIYGTVIGPSIAGEGIREYIFVQLLGDHVGGAKAFLFSHLGFWADNVLSFVGGLILLLGSTQLIPHVDLTQLQKAKLSGMAALGEDEIRSYRRLLWNTLLACAMGGILGGALTGLLDGLLVITKLGLFSEKWALAYGWIAHGIVGGSIGLGIGCALFFLMLLRNKPWALHRLYAFSGAAVFSIIFFIFGHFRLVRDFLGEQKPSLSDELHFLLLIALCFILLRYGLSCMVRRMRLRRFMSWSGGLLLPLGIALILALYASLTQQHSLQFPESIRSPLAGKVNPVILIVVDTLRADHLAPYGNQSIHTPAFSALAADGVLFEQTIAQASWTRPSIATILTGLYPSAHGAVRKTDILQPNVPRLSQALQQQGIYTASLVNNFNIAPSMGFDRGYHLYRYLEPQRHYLASESGTRLLIYEILRRVHQKFQHGKIDVLDFYHPAEEVLDLAGRWTNRLKSSPFFFLIHLMDPHDPYMVHPLARHEGYARLNWAKVPADMAAKLNATYSGEVEYLDSELGKFLQTLKSQGVYDKATIIITGDHGEEFKEHGGWWHGATLYEEQIHVPLIIKLPHQQLAGTRVPYLVRLLDIAPTICSLMNVTPPSSMQGHALFSQSQLSDPQLQYVYSEEDFEGNVLHAARGLEWKLQLAGPKNPRPLPLESLFNLKTDPQEKSNIAESQRDQVKAMGSWISAEQKRAAR